MELMLNSRPLISLSSDPNDLITVIPAQFLIGDTAKDFLNTMQVIRL